MTPQRLIGIGVRLFAAWLALTSIPYWGAIPSQLKVAELETGTSVLTSYVLAGGYVVAAICLVVLPDVRRAQVAATHAA